MRTLQISEETYEKLKDQLTDEVIEIETYKDLVGKSFYFRTVTFHLVGKVKKIIGNFAELECASWVPDSGRFSDAIKEGTLDEVEPTGSAFVNLSAVTDFFFWKHKLPTEKK